MYWLLAGIALCATIVLAGRAHSKYLDRRDEEAWRNPMNPPPAFAVVCEKCGSVSIAPDDIDDVPSAVIKCKACGAARGTRGALQSLANSNRKDFIQEGPGE